MKKKLKKKKKKRGGNRIVAASKQPIRGELSRLVVKILILYPGIGNDANKRIFLEKQVARDSSSKRTHKLDVA